MLKFIKHHLDSILGIEIFPVLSFMIFFIFFLVLFIRVVTADKKETEEISRIPLDTENQPLS